MPDTSKAVEAVSKPIFDQAVWGAIPSALWVVATLVVIYWYKDQIRKLLAALADRLKAGSSLKLAGFEIGTESGLVATPGDFSNEDSRIGVHEDDGKRGLERTKLYEQCRGAMLVHRIQRSTEDGQLYDVLIYVIPHKRSSLAGVSSVEYFLGHYWGDKVFPSFNRSRGFAIVTSAYGPFICTAKVNFNDGTSVTLSRYIDFEMGGCVPSRT